MKHSLLTILFIFSMFTSLSFAQDKDKINLRIYVSDLSTKEALPYANIQLTGEKKYSGITDEQGNSYIPQIIQQKYVLHISYIGFNDWQKTINLKNDTVIYVNMFSNQTALDEIVVTAEESKGLTSSSIIDRRAMEHLQPSSFSDLLELLPGNKSSAPNLTSVNVMSIREVGRPSENHDTNTLGTAFLVDGIPISTNANMQYKDAGNEYMGSVDLNKKYSVSGKGVDMRSISTDDIEHIEIVRGIPSVRYGNLTSGMVKIERKRGRTPLNARFKADGVSKLFSLGKGLDIKGTSVNIDLNYLDSKASPTDWTSNFKRINISTRIQKKWDKESFSAIWSPSFDYGKTIDNLKTDPDRDFAYVDKYSSAHNSLSLRQSLNFKFKKAGILKAIELENGVALDIDKIKQTKFVQPSEPSFMSNTTIPGDYDSNYLPSSWTSYSEVDGKPLNIYLQATGIFSFRTFGLIHDLNAGTEWSFDKNYGKGQIYDLNTPPSADVTSRPRAYSDIPAMNNLTFFAEDVIGFPVGNNYVKVSGGIRAASLLNLDSKYEMSGKLYIDPRMNMQWSFPKITIAEKQMAIDFTAGYGWHSRFPTLSDLYPNYTYIDIAQLNYYHNNPDYRRIYLRTYIQKHINYNIKPAVNKKLDLRLNFSYDNNNLSITFYNEVMSNGFRNQVAEMASLPYTVYTASEEYANNHIGKPNLEDLDSREDMRLTSFSYTGNGSRTNKHGIEFTFQSKRIEALKTRVTINGAWQENEFDNSTPYYRSASTYINNEYVQLIGIYKSEGGYWREKMQTNFTFDTYIPSLDFEFSTSAQCEWFYMKQNKSMSETPDYYYDKQGRLHIYTDTDKTDAVLKELYHAYNQNSFRKERTPLGIDINLKATKKFKEKVIVSLYVNSLFNYYPDYEVNGAIIRRNQNPYFGMELKFNL